MNTDSGGEDNSVCFLNRAKNVVGEKAEATSWKQQRSNSCSSKGMSGSRTGSDSGFGRPSLLVPVVVVGISIQEYSSTT